MHRFWRSAAVAVLLLAVFSPVGSYPQSAPAPSAQAPAAEAGPPSAPDEASLPLAEAAPGAGLGSSSSMLPYLLRMVLVLGLIIAVIYALYAMLRRSARPKTQEDSFLRVLATTSLGAGRQVHVVTLGEKAWLIGTSDATVNLIA